MELTMIILSFLMPLATWLFFMAMVIIPLAVVFALVIKHNDKVFIGNVLDLATVQKEKESIKKAN